MPLSIRSCPETELLEIELSGRLSFADFREFTSRFKPVFHGLGNHSILFDMKGFLGFDRSGQGEVVKPRILNASSLLCIAMVGDKTWHFQMAECYQAYTAVEVRHFTCIRIDDARRWANSHTGDRIQCKDDPLT